VRYVKAHGDALRDFAVFLALRAQLAPQHGPDWRRWPAAFRDPVSPAVRDFAAVHADDVGFHCYLQFELDRQLGEAAAHARAAGLDVGLYQDLAIGSSPGGSDAWAFSDLFVTGATLGAPPDTWYRRGQDWGFHPLDPRRLAARGYDYWIRLLRAGLAHAGALRIDHVIGLFRQFWIPSGGTPAEGGYVRFPTEDLLAILALESGRAGALVIGEDLGTVPRGLTRTLAAWGVLSTRILYFARDRRGQFLPAGSYPPRALVSANTHDMAPLAGYWVGRDLELRWRAGQIRSRSAFAHAKQERRAELAALAHRVAPEGPVSRPEASHADAEMRGAVHAFLCRTPAALVGLSLDDLVGEREPVNLPGAGPDVFPSWSRRLRMPTERLRTAPEVRAALGPVLRTARARRRRRRRRGTRGRSGRR
jgi:4-alpha-glucanotransferase